MPVLSPAPLSSLQEDIPLQPAGRFEFTVDLAELGIDRALIEPMVASFVIAIPTTFLLIQSQTVRTMPTFLYVVMSAIGIMNFHAKFRS